MFFSFLVARISVADATLLVKRRNHKVFTAKGNRFQQPGSMERVSARCIGTLRRNVAAPFLEGRCHKTKGVSVSSCPIHFECVCTSEGRRERKKWVGNLGCNVYPFWYALWPHLSFIDIVHPAAIVTLNLRFVWEMWILWRTKEKPRINTKCGCLPRTSHSISYLPASIPWAVRRKLLLREKVTKSR